MLQTDGKRLIRRFDSETLWIEPWGENSLRVRATALAVMPETDWALLPPEDAPAEITLGDKEASIRCGKLTATVSPSGKLRFFNERGELLLEEFVRDMSQRDFSSHMRISARELKGSGGLYQATQRFESDPEEKLYGMGQYQQGIFNLKGATLELMQRNAQCSVPFVLSSKGYGMLWHNPAVGEVTFGTNLMRWRAEATTLIDYWITADDTPSGIIRRYVRATGLPPMMPESAMGFWQSKLRYRTQDELLRVAREYKRRGLPLSVIVIDFYHWTKFGEWKFDAACWPDPAGMVEELKAMGVETAVSVWPSVQVDSENFGEMLAKGYLTQVDTGVRLSMLSASWTIFYDATNPEARAYVWEKLKKNYHDAGIRYFWLDAAEPQYASYLNYGAEAYRYAAGPHQAVGNVYPQCFVRGVYEGMVQAGETNPLSLVRCAWAGSQRYGALVWSGDIHCGFKSMRWQLTAGLQMAVAGISWWTTDTGGFDWGNIQDTGFRELMVRWFEWSTFCPVLRMHGDRQPRSLAAESGLTDYCGADNEIWSFGEEACAIMSRYLKLREAMRPYIRDLMRAYHETGAPVMRPLFYHYPQDAAAWTISDSYLFGRDVLVAPVMEAGAVSRRVYLPSGSDWLHLSTGRLLPGGQWVEADAPLDTIPIFIRDAVAVPGLHEAGAKQNAPSK